MTNHQQFPWPDHWYYNPGHIRCIVRYCGFITDTNSVQHQWYQIHNHSMDAPGPEHKLLEVMLRQIKCAVAECTLPKSNNHPSFKIRTLFHHEKTFHGTTAMSNICSFVRLAREGRIRIGSGSGHGTVQEPTCEEFAFYRMKEKAWALPAAEIGLLFQKSGFHHSSEQTDRNLEKILTHDPLAVPGDNPPFWWPVNVEHFLSFCRPHPTDPADHSWRILWNDLRAKYADGRI